MVSTDARVRPIAQRATFEAQILTEVLRQDESRMPVHHCPCGDTVTPMSSKLLIRFREAMLTRARLRAAGATSKACTAFDQSVSVIKSLLSGRQLGGSERSPPQSLCFGNSGSAFCCPGTGRQPAVESALFSRHHPHDALASGSRLGAAPRSEFALQR